MYGKWPEATTCKFRHISCMFTDILCLKQNKEWTGFQKVMINSVSLFLFLLLEMTTYLLKYHFKVEQILLYKSISATLAQYWLSSYLLLYLDVLQVYNFTWLWLMIVRVNAVSALVTSAQWLGIKCFMWSTMITHWFNKIKLLSWSAARELNVDFRLLLGSLQASC